MHTCNVVADSRALPWEVGALRVLQHPLACSPRNNGGAGGAVLKIDK